MSFIYDAITESCYDPQSGITARWGGSNGFGDFARRAFIFSHEDWEARYWWANQEANIERLTQIGDLSKNQLSVSVHLGPNAAVHFQPSAPAEIVRGIPPASSEFVNLQHDAISCLYTKGGSDAIHISGISPARDKGHGAKAL